MEAKGGQRATEQRVEDAQKASPMAYDRSREEGEEMWTSTGLPKVEMMLVAGEDGRLGSSSPAVG